MAADPEGSIFQRFDYLSARNLLYLQSNLNELQAKLDDLNKFGAEVRIRDEETRLSAKAYSDLKTKAQWYIKEAERNGAASMEGWTVARGDKGEGTLGKNALERTEVHKQIKEAMREYHEADLVTLVQADDDRLSRVLRHVFGRWFRDRKRNPQPDLDLYYFSEDRIQLTSYIITIIFSGILLLGAMACLGILNDKSWKLRLGLLAIFTSLFAVVIGLLTNAKRNKIFASTAAYAAVLAVYVSANLGPSD
ncbi:hypothetical protein G7Y89_g136 [Cudoniella acicularis]|uniref:DUF6594 domain-containing protein n=1 Tax=Cudoniella acicularis TaxID=354080 RepID=A0A8H4W866_9HELO|nr:hypothetical protein G7Y89_g136 [Cudoniella acicularis]